MDEKVKQLLLKLLDKFVEVCEQNHLQYYLAGGSVIGAVRHKGFIPWDDDIDVHMPRADYEKLQLLPDSVLGDDMRLATWRKTKNYTYDFLKLELLNTTVIERLHPDYVGGVFLDVFPLDYITDDKEQVKVFEKQYTRIVNRFIRCTITNDDECTSIWDLLCLRIERRLYNHRRWMEKWENLAIYYSKQPQKMSFSHEYFYYKRGMEIEWFGDGALLDFEGRQVLVPSNYDAYLKHIFGDYMKLPPIEKRIGHNFLYVNYDRRITDSEANEIFNELHRKFTYKASLKREIKYILRRLKIVK